jgi:Flp pilus assembly protein TadG
MTLLVLGVIDMGQYVNIYQKVGNASREGARVAAKHDTATTTQVQAAVMDYLEDASAGTSSAILASATQVTVTDALGSPISGGDLTKLPTGSEIKVRATLHYNLLRWIAVFRWLDGQEIVATTVMLRE